MKKITLFMVVMLIMISFSAIAETDSYMEGLESYYQGNYQESITILDEVLNDEESADEDVIQSALYYQSLAYIKLNDANQVQENISKLEDMGYQSGRLHWQLGQIYLNKEGQFDSANYDLAVNELEKAGELGVDSIDFVRDLAKAYQGSGKLDQAIREYDKVINDNGTANDYLNIATLYKEKEMTGTAIKYYEQAAELEPNNLSICLNLGKLYLISGNNEQAINILEKGRELRPDYGAIRFQLGLAYYNADNLTAARSEFETTTNLHKHNYQAYYYLGNICQQNENWQQAIDYYQQAIKYNADYTEAFLEIGKVYLKQEDYYEAISQLMTALEKNKNYPPTHYYLGLAYRELDMREAAISEFRKTVHLDSDYKDAGELLKELQQD